jgi:ABC-type transporter Mla maintaining outer membrane lipid asymmetry permease subunit MlaE
MKTTEQLSGMEMMAVDPDQANRGAPLFSPVCLSMPLLSIGHLQPWSAG